MIFLLAGSEVDSHPPPPFLLLWQNSDSNLCWNPNTLPARGETQGGESGSKELGAHLLQNNNFWYKELNFGVQEEIKIEFRGVQLFGSGITWLGKFIPLRAGVPSSLQTKT